MFQCYLLFCSHNFQCYSDFSVWISVSYSHTRRFDQPHASCDSNSVNWGLLETNVDFALPLKGNWMICMPAKHDTPYRLCFYVLIRLVMYFFVCLLSINSYLSDSSTFNLHIFLCVSLYKYVFVCTFLCLLHLKIHVQINYEC